MLASSSSSSGGSNNNGSNNNNNQSITNKNNNNNLDCNRTKKIGLKTSGGVIKNARGGTSTAATTTTTTATKMASRIILTSATNNATNDNNMITEKRINNNLDDHDDIDHDLGDLLNGDKGKRRTDRSDSSESSDSGVATLSPSTSDSPELISPYSPCDLSSEQSDAISFCGSGSSLGNSPSISSSPPLICDLGPEFDHSSSSNSISHSFPASTTTTTTMTAVASATLDSGPPPHLSSVVTNKAKVPVTSFITFEMPQTQSHLQSTTNFSNPIKLLGDSSKTNNVQSTFNCDVRKFASASNIKNLIAALGYEPKNGSVGVGGGSDTVVSNCNNGGTATLQAVERATAQFSTEIKNRVDFQSATMPGSIRATTTTSAKKSFILRGDGSRNGKVIILSVKPTTKTLGPTALNCKSCTVVVPSIPKTTTSANTKNIATDKSSTIHSKVSTPPTIVLPSLRFRKKPQGKSEEETSLTKCPLTNTNNATTTTQSSPSTISSGDGIKNNSMAESSDINNSYRNYANPSLHLNGPKKTDDSIEAIKTSKINININNNNNHSTIKSSQPKRISLRNSDISNRLMHLSSKTTTQTSPAQTKQKLTSSNNNNNNVASLLSTSKQNVTTNGSKDLPRTTIGMPQKEILSTNLSIMTNSNNNNNRTTIIGNSVSAKSPSLSSGSTTTISSSPNFPVNYKSQNIAVKTTANTNSSLQKDLITSKSSLFTNSNGISSINNNNSSNNNANSNSTRKRKPVSFSTASNSSSSCSSPCCVPVSYDDHDADTQLGETIISSPPCSLVQVSNKSSSSSTCSEESKNKITSIYSSLNSSPSTIITTCTNISDTTHSLLVKCTASEKPTEFCMWKDCKCIPEANLDFLEHIQTAHVAPQTKPEGYVCLWEGCKVYNKKSCSLSWLEHHVLTHGGNKPFRCIFAGCGLSFGTQGALERHVNSHIISNGNAATNGHSSITKKMDTTPSKIRRKKQRILRNAKINTGHVVDFFDKRTMEVIKYRLCSSAEFEDSVHNCTFKSQVLSRRTSTNQEPHLFVRWYPEFVFPDEWIPQSKYEATKTVPFRQIPSDKIKILFPQMFPPERKEKAQRKWKPSSKNSNNQLYNPKLTIKSEDGCTCPSTSSDSCTDLNSDWAVFLAQRYLS